MIVVGAVSLLAFIAFIVLIIIYGIKKRSIIKWVIYSTVALFMMIIGFATGLPSHTTSSSSTISSLKPLPVPFIPPGQAEKDYKVQSQPVNISDIIKQPSGKPITFSGSVIGFEMNSNENTYWCKLSDSNTVASIVEVSLSLPDIGKTQVGNALTIWGEWTSAIQGRRSSGDEVIIPRVEMRYLENLTSGYTSSFIKISYLPGNGLDKTLSTRSLPQSEWGIGNPPGHSNIGVWVNRGSGEHPVWQSQTVGVTRIDDLKRYDCTWSPIDHEITFGIPPPDLPNSIAIQYTIY